MTETLHKITCDNCNKLAERNFFRLYEQPREYSYIKKLDFCYECAATLGLVSILKEVTRK